MSEQNRKRVIRTAVLLAIGVGLLTLLGRFIAEDVGDFLKAACPWLLIALGIAVALASGYTDKQV